MAAVAVPRSTCLSYTSSSDFDFFYRKSGSWEMATPQETSYSVVVFDGEQYVDAGHVGIFSATQFKALRVALSQKTGVPPKRISVALVCRRGSKSSEKRRQKRLSINENTNFAWIIAHHNPRTEKDCFLLVTTRKSRRGRERRARSRRNVVGDDGDGSGSSLDDLSPPVKPYSAPPTVPEKALLRRDPHPTSTAGLLDLSSVQICPPTMNGLLGTMHEHDSSMVIGPFAMRNLPLYAFKYIYPYAYNAYTTSARRDLIAVCETCSEAGGGREVAFHPCVYDEVLDVWRRSPPAGPIQRPSKPGRIEAAA